ncbi:AMP-binding protein [Profundibacterium mesophilum]|uniref:4-coumarate--CoA ligase n=1 Tax=Profundibacterium mesophilum KAUST100406-0324 TaxID=1037889 RepID=A0A921NTG5_9RHOB|nr:AMP-binding protein [Profundibacterium mesophilum]KAF0676294.1 4-coumarate--CoA ligase [Profundibacterium mesophilum KAUST100406-0324]
MLYKSESADVTIPERSVTSLVLETLERRGGATVLTEGTSGRSMSGAELAAGIRKLAGGLAKRGIGPGSRVALMAPNIPEYCLVFHAVLWAGATITTVNPTYTAHELNHQLVDSGAELLIVAAPFLETARQGAEESRVREIAVIGAAQGSLTLDDLMGSPMPEQTPIDLHADVAAMPYSSGTTGMPKGVMLSHRNLLANTLQVRSGLDFAEDETTIAFLPFFHIYGLTVMMNVYLSSGGHLVTLPRFDLPLFLELTQKHKARKLFVVPPVVLALAKHPAVEEYDLSSVETIMSGAAPLGAELADACAARLGCDVIQGYGMTEMSPVSHLGRPLSGKTATSGRPLAGTECRIVDPETGKDRAAGEEGELWVRGPQVMLGYLDNEQATRETIVEDGWLRTGDLAIVDDDGDFVIQERVKELIKVKGFQVAPAEIEALLLAHPQIADAAVRARKDEEAGERPVAFVVRAQNSQIDADEVKAHVAAKLSSYKHLAAVEFLDAIPKSASGKILRRQLPA